jgi:outer membrane protein assembly factor BamB
MTAIRLLATLGLVLLAGGCSTLDKLNPFADEPKIKPAALESFAATAELRVDWQASIGASGESILAPAVVDDSVFAAAADGSVGRFDDGKQRWRISAGQRLSAGVGADDKVVVVATNKGDVLAFAAEDGSVLWKAQVSSEVLAPPVVAEGLVIVRSGDSRIYALDAKDGKRRWMYQRTAPALSLRKTVGVVAVPGVVLAGMPAGKLVAINTVNGAVIWEVTVAQPKGATELERVADISSLPMVADRQICAVAFQGRLACFDPSSSTLIWGQEVSSSAGLDADAKQLYVSDDKGRVLAFEREGGSRRWTQDKLALRRLSRPLAIGRFVAVGDYQGQVHLLKGEDGTFAARLATDGSDILADPVRLPGGGFLVQTRAGGLFSLSVR